MASALSPAPRALSGLPPLCPLEAKRTLARAASDVSRLAWRSVGWGLAILLALQVWRPYFFLTDDNLVGLLPVVTSVGRSLARGQSPFWVETLFGGLDLLRDPGGLCLWNPLVMVLALLTQTPLRLAVVDIFVGAHLLLAAFCCAHLLARWRAMFGLALSDRRLIFLSVSYAFSAFSIIVCASWNSFAANIVAAPLALLGMFHPSRAKGVALVLASTVLSLLTGHLSPFAWAALSLTAFALLWPFAAPRASSSAAASTCEGPEPPRESHWKWEVPLRWIGGSLLALAACSPLLWLAMSGFAQTTRSTSLPMREVLWMQVPPQTFALSWLAGSLSALSDAGRPLLLMQLPSGASHAIALAGAGHFIALALGKTLWKRGVRRVDVLFAALSLGVVLVVARPLWLQLVVEKLPILRSLRFPFREIWLFHLWTHAWMAWRAQGLSARHARLSALSGTVVLSLSLLLWSPPTFSRLSLTREWVISGRAQRFWDWMRPQLPPGSRLLPIVTPEQWSGHEKMPFPLLCAFNFPALFDVPSQSGYVIKGLEHGAVRSGAASNYAGLLSPREGREALRRDPKIVLVRIQSLQPLIVVFEGRGFHRAVRPNETAP